MIKLLVSEANGKYLYEPKTVAVVEHILGAVVLLRRPIYSLGLGCVINVFRTAQALNIGLEIGAEKDNLYLKPDLTVTHFLLFLSG